MKTLLHILALAAIILAGCANSKGSSSVSTNAENDSQNVASSEHVSPTPKIVDSNSSEQPKPTTTVTVDEPESTVSEEEVPEEETEPNTEEKAPESGVRKNDTDFLRDMFNLLAGTLSEIQTIYDNVPIDSTENISQSEYSNYEPSSSDCDGMVVYEGSGDYYIVETDRGYTVLEVYSGILYEYQSVRGQLNSYNMHYILNLSRDSEVRVYVEDFMLSYNRALEWLGEHDKLSYSDQEEYDRKKESY